MVAHSEKTKALSKWFESAISSLDSFGRYDQLQILMCAHAIQFSHPSIKLKLEELVNALPPFSADHVYEYLEQLVFIKYDVAEVKQQQYFNYWFGENNYLEYSQVTQAYLMGNVLLEENKIASTETKQLAVQWLIDNPDIPSMSF